MRSRNRQHYESYGNLFFITSVVVGHISMFNHNQYSDIFVSSLKFYQDRGDITLIAWVLMPNHFHLIAKTNNVSNISTVIGGLKRYTSRKVGELLQKTDNLKLIKLLREAAIQEPGKATTIWKPRFDSLVITSEEVLKQKIDYIHTNPVRKGLVDEPTQWYYSSASAYEGKSGIDVEVDTKWRCLGYTQ